MRKVMYSLNSLSEPTRGYFHCWAGTMQDAYAIIEDTTTGKMHRVNDDQLMFITPPEVIDNSDCKFDKQDLKDTIGLVVVKIDSLAPRTERIQNISDALKEIMKKL